MDNKRGRHTSTDKHIKLSLSWLEAFECVQKVVLGISEGARHKYAPGTLRYQKDSPGGIQLRAYTGKGVLNIYVKVNDEFKKSLIKKIQERWS